MTRRRFYSPPESITSDAATFTLSVDESRHLREVLRLRADDEAFVFDGEGREYACTVRDPGRRGTDRAVLEKRQAVTPLSPESPLVLTLAVALLKGEKFDMVVQKASELGVARIIPTMTLRADIRSPGESQVASRIERWRRLALEACKQCGRARLPQIEMPVALDALLSRDDEARIVFAERGGDRFATLAESAAHPKSLTVAVGPEGGWDDAEIAQARDSGWTIVTMGGRILRAETAAIVVTALVQHRFGDL
jgi:16S rRNA (uracil1498-N3)-methyltransferase